MLLALDLSQACTGYAVGGKDTPRPRAGVWRFPKGEHNFDRTLHSLRLAVATMVRTEKVQHLWIEAAWNRVDAEHSAWVAELSLSLVAVAREGAYSNGCRNIHTVAAPTWRKTFIGHGYPESPKKAAKDRCTELGWIYETDDDAEAQGVWFHGISKL